MSKLKEAQRRNISQEDKMTIKPAAKTEEEIQFKLLGIVENKIAEEELYGLPCRACTACQFTTCRKAGLFRLRQTIHAEMYG